MFSGFDWDEGNREKCQLHGVPLTDIEGMFAGEVAVFPDLSHSQTEMRLNAIGRSLTGRHIVLVFTVRMRNGERYLRPISARYMHQKEIALYEKRHPGV